MTALLIGYIISGIVFAVGLVGYWVVTRELRDPTKIYQELR